MPSYQLQQLDRVVAPPELDERFDVVDDEADRPGLDDALAAHELDVGLEVRHDAVRLAEREVEVAERRRPHRAREPVRAEREDLVGCLRQLLGAAELCLDEAFECKAERAKEGLSRLLGGLLAVECEREGGLEVSECELDLAEQDREPGSSVLVAALIGTLQQLDEGAARPIVRVDPDPVLGHRDKRLVEDAAFRRRALERLGPFGGPRRRRRIEEGLGSETDHQHVCGQRLVAQLLRQGERDAREFCKPSSNRS